MAVDLDIDEIFTARHADRLTEECGGCGGWTPGRPLSEQLFCDDCQHRVPPPADLMEAA